MADAKRDANQVTTLIAVSNADGTTPVVLWADPTTHRLLVSAVPGSLDDLSDVVITSGAQGDILYFNGTNWVNLAAGTSGKFLKTQGAGANPIWDTPASGAAGADTQVQFNDGGTNLGGDAGFVYNKTTNTATLDVIQLTNSGLKVLDSDASHYLIITPGSNISANRVFTITTGDAARTLDMSGGNITLAGAFVTSGANSLTLTTTGATNVTLPTSGTLATLAGTEALTNKTIGNTNTVTLKDTLFTIQDDGDATKLIAFQASGITTGNTRTITMPDSNTTLPIVAQIVTIAGPTAARTYTFPDAAATIARTDAGQTFTGVNTFTSPKIITDISDTNGNEVFKITATASAVNEFTVVNAATGNAVDLQATGGDTNIDIKLTPKGSGKVAPQKSVNFGAFTAYFTETDNGNSGASDTIDWTVSNKQKSTLTGNCTFTFTAPPGPCSLILKLVQDGTGSRTVTWPAAVHWSGGTAPTLTTTASKVDIISFYYDGSTYFGTSSLNYTA